MKKTIWLIPAAGVLGAILFASIGVKHVAPEAASLQAARGTTGQFCLGQAKCLVAFVAPWCGYCRRSTPMMQALLTKYHGAQNFRVNVVVTGDEAPSMDSYASELGAGAFIDQQNTFATSVGIRGFPTWVLFDASGKSLKSQSGAFPTSEQLFAHMGITPQ